MTETPHSEPGLFFALLVGGPEFFGGFCLAIGLIAWSPDQPHTAGSAGVPAPGRNFFPPRRRIRRLMFV